MKAEVSFDRSSTATLIPGLSTWSQMHRCPSGHYAYYTMPQLIPKVERRKDWFSE